MIRRLLAALQRRRTVAEVQRARRREGWPNARGHIYTGPGAR